LAKHQGEREGGKKEHVERCPFIAGISVDNFGPTEFWAWNFAIRGAIEEFGLPSARIKSPTRFPNASSIRADCDFRALVIPQFGTDFLGRML